MRRTAFGAALAGAAILTGAAVAQTTTVAPGGSTVVQGGTAVVPSPPVVTPGTTTVVPGATVTPGGVDLRPDEEVVVREYIVRRRPTPIVVEGGTVRPGSIVPADVDLQAFDESALPSLRRYAYFVSPDSKIVVVEPTTRQVVRILNR